VVDQAMQALTGDTAIDYVVIAKNDGFSIVIDRASWRTEKLGDIWRPAHRMAASSIGTSPLFGRRVFKYAFPFDYSGLQWGWIHIGLSLDAYDQSVRRTYQGTGLLALLCGGLSLVISLVYAARLVRPIQVLHSAVEKVTHGDLSARAEVNSRDEIESLAVAFNDMARTILGRNQILESVSFAAKQFLSDGDLDTIFGRVLEKVGQAAHVSRASVLSIQESDGALRLYEKRKWLAAGVSDSDSAWQDYPWHAEDMRDYAALLRGGQIVTVAPARCDIPGDPPGRPVRSAILLPVMVNGEWWGIAAFDDFVQEREWGEAERDCLRAVADMIGASMARQRVRTALVEAKETLVQRVIERTHELQNLIEAKDRAHADLAAAQQRLIELSRRAEMAEIATGVLHNVGNVLNSVNVSTSLIAGKVRESRLDHLNAAIQMLAQHTGDLTVFLENDPKGRRLLPYLAKLADHFRWEREGLLTELESLSSHVGHIKQIVATQQSYAKVSGLVENTRLSEMVDDALRIEGPGLARHAVTVERDFEELPLIALDKHNVLQILLNLLRNAKQALSEANGGRRRVVRVRIRRSGENRVSVAVEDNGVGIAPENLTRIFRHGFTTKADGHGFGLHSAALAARQMGGSLHAKSTGPGEGATFILEMPLNCADDLRKRVLT
jgi:signal transduction histidine kinase